MRTLATIFCRVRYFEDGVGCRLGTTNYLCATLRNAAQRGAPLFTSVIFCCHAGSPLVLLRVMNYPAIGTFPLFFRFSLIHRESMEAVCTSTEAGATGTMLLEPSTTPEAHRSVSMVCAAKVLYRPCSSSLGLLFHPTSGWGETQPQIWRPHALVRDVFCSASTSTSMLSGADRLLPAFLIGKVVAF